ncbi:DUF7882 family protein [Agrococcus jejuensis]|uniref:DUF7882 domain-containing protein n=1 Tax=Agrococcus jejuensis TaxID=399736 RepID=A0A1G8ERH4_9MICO|nr:hypothetical protein [Agrococcus jejuensis]SDH72474.1 hypothetical protein SAMN04489720_2161 [Agrococcus jejuensis]
MGTLKYGNGDDATFTMDDVDLAHLAAVVTAKLRRREPFLLTCRSETTRQSIWIHEASTLVYGYETPAAIDLDRARLEAMVVDTNRPTGLTVRCEARALHAVGALAAAA